MLFILYFFYCSAKLLFFEIITKKEALNVLPDTLFQFLGLNPKRTRGAEIDGIDACCRLVALHKDGLRGVGCRQRERIEALAER